MKHTTARGDSIDMSALAAQNSEEVALGNARMNARGDILGDHGIILKTQEQIEAEWAAQQEQSNVKESRQDIKNSLEQMVASGAPKKNPNLMVDRDFDMDLVNETSAGRPDVAPESRANKPARRKIVDSE